jgi:hypothetical protein
MTTLRARTVFSDEKVTVTTLELLEFRTDRLNHLRYVTGDLRPMAIVVKEPDRTYAFDMAAQPIDIERLELQSIEAPS